MFSNNTKEARRLEPLSPLQRTSILRTMESEPSRFQKILAVAISSKPEEWYISDVPFYCYTKGWEAYGRTVQKSGREQLAISRERIEYLANRRNKAVEYALQRFPQSDHILMIDSSYIPQIGPVKKLLEDYVMCRESVMLGATTWSLHKRAILPKVLFYDFWSTPEARFIPYDFEPQKDNLVGQFRKPLPNLMPVRSVGGCYIFPRAIWERGVRYGVLDDLHGCEHNYLCEKSGLPVYLDFNVRLWREPKVYPWARRVRVSLGIRTRIRKMVH